MKGITRRRALRSLGGAALGWTVLRGTMGCGAGNDFAGWMPGNGNNNGNGGGNGNGSPSVLLQVRTDDHVYPGSEGNPHTIIEYGDLECPVCGRFARDNFPDVVARLIDTGEVRWVFRHFPLTAVHPRAFDAALAAECVGEQRFYDYIDVLFANQTALTHDDLVSYAAGLGIAADPVEQCLSARTHADRVQGDLDDALALGASATPTFFVDGTMLSGLHGVEDFEALLE
jgi:protein-disulfide isomerase